MDFQYLYINIEITYEEPWKQFQRIYKVFKKLYSSTL